MAESNLNPFARSPVGALGIMQLMPGTAKDLGVDPRDPESNIRGGIHFDADLWKTYWNSINDLEERRACVFASYNAGPGWILKARRAANNALTWGDISKLLPAVTGSHAAETIGYVRRIRAYYLQIQ